MANKHVHTLQLVKLRFESGSRRPHISEIAKTTNTEGQTRCDFVQENGKMKLTFNVWMKKNLCETEKNQGLTKAEIYGTKKY